MTDFTSSDGHIRIAYENDIRERIDIFDARGGANMLDGAPWLSSREVSALREFFQHERDEALGRWRWPEHPHFIVHPGDRGYVSAIDESTGAWATASRAEGYINTGHGTIWNAIAAYFEAHPEQKPWMDARLGDVWVISVEGEENIVVHAVAALFGAVEFKTVGGRKVNMNNSTFTGFRKLWPADAS